MKKYLSAMIAMTLSGSLANAQSQHFNDTWAIGANSTSWSKLSPAGTLPAERRFAAHAHDTRRNRLIVVGGERATSPLTLYDTWALDLNTTAGAWTLLNSHNGFHTTTFRAGLYDSLRDRMVAIHSSGVDAMDLNTNLWSPLPTTGLSLTSVVFTTYSGMYDERSDRYIIFGGGGSSTATNNEVRVFDPVMNTWSVLPLSSSRPSQRTHCSVSYDPALDSMLMFGGTPSANISLADTWELSLFPGTEAWSPLTPLDKPMDRSQNAVAYDQVRGRMYIFGGLKYNASTPTVVGLNDLWYFDHNNWTRQVPSGTRPLYRRGAHAAYDLVNDRFVMFGGQRVAAAEVAAEPTGLTAVAVSETQIKLTWTDEGSNESGWRVYRSENGGTAALAGSAAANETSYIDDNLTACNTYAYHVTSYNTTGESGPSNVTAPLKLDKTAPQVTAPGDVTVSNDTGQCSASNVDLGTPQSSDNCAGAVAITTDAPAEFLLGSTTVTWTATDSEGNSTTATQIVTVTDGEAPLISGLEDVTVRNDVGTCQASGVELGTPVVSDNCASNIDATNDAPAVFSMGNTQVTWTAIDLHGNAGTFIQNVTVEDKEAPVITCPDDMAVGCNVALLTPVYYETPAATDLCSNNVTVVCNPQSGSGFPVGTTPVTVTATDGAGNSSTCTFNVVRESLEFVGFSAPIGGCVENGDGGSFSSPTRTFRLGTIVPVRFQLGCDGTPVSEGVHTLQAYKYDSVPSADTPVDATPGEGATAGVVFNKTAQGTWYFNLKTRDGFSVGTWLLVATLSDGSRKSVWVDLK